MGPKRYKSGTSILWGKREKHDPFMKMGVDILRISYHEAQRCRSLMTLQTRHVSLLVLARSKDGQSWVPGRGCSIAVVEGWW